MATRLSPFANDKIDQFREWEYSSPAGNANAEGGDEDEEGTENELCFGEERKAKVYEDKILRELSQDLKEVLCGKLGAAGHVIICVVFECDAAE